MRRIGIGLLAATAAVSIGAQELDGNGWRGVLGFSFVATSGNTDSSSLGLSAAWDRQEDLWVYAAGADALQTEEDGETVAERYSAFARGSREIRNRLGLTGGWQAERGRFTGVELRSTFDFGVDWKAVDRDDWEVSTVLSATWTSEDLVGVERTDHVGALFLARSVWQISETAKSTQLVRFEPNFENSDDFRTEGRVSLQSDLTDIFALKLGASILYDNEPVPGFESTDSTFTASIVLNVERLEVSE